MDFSSVNDLDWLNDTDDINHDYNKLYNDHKKEGFREGLENGKEKELQNGFNNGFTLSARKSFSLSSLYTLISLLQDYSNISNEQKEKLNSLLKHLNNYKEIIKQELQLNNNTNNINNNEQIQSTCCGGSCNSEKEVLSNECCNNDNNECSKVKSSKLSHSINIEKIEEDLNILLEDIFKGNDKITKISLSSDNPFLNE